MNTNQQGTPCNRVWQGEPWTDAMTAVLGRPSDATRAVIYGAARAALPAVPIHARVWHLVWGRASMSLATWAACASLVFSLCIWQGSSIGPGMDLKVGNADVRAFADDIEQFSHAALITENNSTDINDIVFVDELQSVSRSLIALADDLEFGHEL